MFLSVGTSTMVCVRSEDLQELVFDSVGSEDQTEAIRLVGKLLYLPSSPIAPGVSVPLRRVSLCSPGCPGTCHHMSCFSLPQDACWPQGHRAGVFGLQKTRWQYHVVVASRPSCGRREALSSFQLGSVPGTMSTILSWCRCQYNSPADSMRPTRKVAWKRAGNTPPCADHPTMGSMPVSEF